MTTPTYISGSAVAERAASAPEGESFGLEFFLQSLAAQRGLRWLADDILRRCADLFPLELKQRADHELAGWIISYCTGNMYSGSQYPKCLPILRQYRRRYEAASEAGFAMTTIGREVFAALDRCRRIGRMVLVEGASGVGKSTAAEAWFDRNRDAARFVRLQAVNSRKLFFLTLAQTFGIEHTEGLSADRLQIMVQSFLQKTRQVLIIDEAQYLFPQGESVSRHPVFINWINTALANEGVPVAMVATAQFAARRRAVETQTTWDSFQLRRRIRHVFTLPATPTKKDLMLVAGRRLPGADAVAIELIVGYAMASKGFMQAVCDVIDDARLIADDAGRKAVTAEDVDLAIEVWRKPSDTAQKRIFAPQDIRRSVPAGGRQMSGNAVAVEAQTDLVDDGSTQRAEAMPQNRLRPVEVSEAV